MLKDDKHPFIRLDFILLSDAIIQDAKRTTLEALNNINNNNIDTSVKNANIDIDNSVAPSDKVSNKSNNNSMNDNQTHSILLSLRAGVDVSNTTQYMSDHFPVYASWRDPSVGDIELY